MKSRSTFELQYPNLHSNQWDKNNPYQGYFKTIPRENPGPAGQPTQREWYDEEGRGVQCEGEH